MSDREPPAPGIDPLAEPAMIPAPAPAPTPAALESVPLSQGISFGHFVVSRRSDGQPWELGRGAMGVTYRAFDTGLRVEVALKVITAERVHDEDTRRRFLREARAAAKIRHPNVASVLYLGERGGEFFYAMEFIEGRTLAELLEETRTLPLAVALALGGQAAAALAAAHRQQVLHRDLKPANLMLVESSAEEDHEDERAAGSGHRLLKVIDFGLARRFGASSGRSQDSLATQLQTAGFIGSPAYASPEQCAGAGDLDGRSDLYSLGVILWQSLAGRLPFTGTIGEVLGKQQFQPPPLSQLAGLPTLVVELLAGLLEKDPDARRPASAAELRDQLDACRRTLDAVDATTHLAPASLPLAAESEDLRLPTIGTSLSARYRLGRDLGEGDGGRLFQAADNVDGRTVAVKLLRTARAAAEPGLLPLAERAVDLARRETHPALLAHRTLERTGQGAYYVRDWADGFSLLDLLRERHGALRAAEVFRLLSALPAALDFATSKKFPLLSIALHKIFVVPPPVGANSGGGAAPAGWPVLRERPVESWPEFTLLLNPIGFPPSAHAAVGPNETLTWVETRRGEAGNGDLLPDFARLVRELLGAAPDSLTPVTALNSESNAVLRRCLEVPDSGRNTFGDCVSFWEALCTGAVPEASSPGVRLGRRERGEASARSAANLALAGISLDVFRGYLITAKNLATSIRNVSERAAALRDAAVTQARAGEHAAALTTAQGITEEYFRAWAQHDLAWALAADGDPTGARLAAEAIVDPYFQSLAWRDLAWEQARLGDIDTTRVSVGRMVHSSDRHEGLIAIAIAQARGGEAAGLRGTLEEIREPALRAKGWREVAIALASFGDDANGAGNALLQATVAAKAITPAALQARELAAIAAAWAWGGQEKGAREAIEQALAMSDRIVYPIEKVAALLEIARAQAAAGDFTAAEATAVSIDAVLPRTQALLAVARIQAVDDAASGKAGVIARVLGLAESTARSATDPYEQARALLTVAEGQREIGDSTSGRGILLQAQSAATAISRPAARAAVLAEIAVALAHAGGAEEASRAADSIRDVGARITALAALASVRTEMGDPAAARIALSGAEAAVRTVNSDFLLDTRAKVLALAAVAQAQARGLGFSAAEHWIATLSGAWARCRCFLALAQLALGPEEQKMENLPH